MQLPFECQLFKVILRSFGAFPIFNNLVVPLTFQCSVSFWGHSVHLSKWHVTQKAKRTEIWESERLMQHMEYLCVSCQYSLDLLHSLSKQEQFWTSNVKIRISHFSCIASSYAWLLGIKRTCSNLASDQAGHQGPWVSS